VSHPDDERVGDIVDAASKIGEVIELGRGTPRTRTGSGGWRWTASSASTTDGAAAKSATPSG
jgi:hypothetical protein